VSFPQFRSPRIYNPLGTPPAPASSDFNVSVSEAVTVTESVSSFIPTLNIAVSDSATLTENLQRMLESSVSKSDSVTVTESTNATLASNVSVVDNTTVTESVNRLLESNISKSDSVTVTEAVSAFIPDLKINKSESVTVTEALARMLESSVAKSDTATVTDTPTVLISTLNVAVSDSATLTESLNVSIPAAASEVVDQSQTLHNVGAGFGEFSHVRYRGQGFKPTLNNLSAIEFQRGLGSKGIKIYVDEADSNSFPVHAVGSELYSFTVPNGSITGSFQKFTLPVLLTGLTPGAQYVFYIAPWDTVGNAYADDYQDMQFKNSNAYADGKAIVWDVDGANTWAVSDGGNLDLYFNTYGYVSSEREINVSEHVTVTDSRNVGSPVDANTRTIYASENVTVTDTPYVRTIGNKPLYFDGPSYNALVEIGDSDEPQFKKPGMGSTLYFGDGIKMAFAIKKNTAGSAGDVAFTDTIFNSAITYDRDGRISITGTGSLTGTSLAWENYLAGEPEGDTFYVVMALTNNSGVSKNFVPTLVLPDVNLQNFRWVDVGDNDTDSITYDSTNKYLELTTPEMSNIYVGLKPMNTTMGYKAKTGFSDISADLAAGDLDNTIGALGTTNYIWIEHGTTASPTTIAPSSTATFVWVVAYRTTQAALQSFMAAQTSTPSTSLSDEAAYYAIPRLSATLPFNDEIAQIYDMNAGRLNAMAHSQLIDGKKYVPAGSYTFTFAFGRDGYYGNKALLQAENGRTVTSDEIALFKAFENTGTHEQMHEVAAYTNASGYYETAGNNGTPGDQDAYLILKGYEYYVATKDDAWLATNITYLNNVGTYLYNYWNANKDASNQFAGHGTSTYLDGAGNITGSNPMIDPVLDSLVAYTFSRLAELNTHLGGSYLTTASTLTTASNAIIAGFSSLWNAGANWLYFNKKTDGTTYSNRHVAKVDAALWGVLDGTNSATMASQLIDTGDWWDDPGRNFREVPTSDSLYDGNSYWYDGGWHLTDFKAVETVLRYGTNAQAQSAWTHAQAIAVDRLANINGFLGEKSVNSGTFAFSVGALQEMLVRGLFGIDAHATYFTITPNIPKLALGGTWVLNDLRMGGWAYDVSVTDTGGTPTITINGASYSSGATIYYDPNVSDSVTVSEAVTVAIAGLAPLTVSVSDSITVTESTQRMLESYISKSESVSVSESLQRMLESFISKSESITVTESIQRLLESRISVSDSVTVTEALQRALELFVSKSDSVSVSESLQLLLESFINKSDSVTLTENLQRLLESSLSVSDTATVTEAVQVVISSPLSTSDNVAVSELVRVTLESFINKSENVTVTEALQRVLESSISVSDTTTLSESLKLALESNISKSETISVSESVTVFIPTLNIATSEAVLVAEALTVTRTNANDISINVSDTTTLAESTRAELNSFISKSDTVTVTESLQRSLESFITKSDTATVSEAVTVRTELNIAKSETVTATDSLTVLLPTLSVNVSDTTAVTDAPSVAAQAAGGTGNLLTLLGAG
jgi:hypothetical protein